MPVGFIFLGVSLIYELFFLEGKLQKAFSIAFCLFSMCGYFVKPLYLGNISFNLIICFSAIIMFFYLFFSLTNQEKFVLCYCSIIVISIYFCLCLISVDFVSSLNPYPICFVILLLSVFNLKNFKLVFCLNQFSFILINVFNLVLEKPLNYINFANVEFFNLMLVILAVVLTFKFLIFNLKIFKRGKYEKNFNFNDVTNSCFF